VVGAGILLTKIDRFDFLIFCFEISVTQKSRRQELIGTKTFRFQLVQFSFVMTELTEPIDYTRKK